MLKIISIESLTSVRNKTAASKIQILGLVINVTSDDC